MEKENPDMASELLLRYYEGLATKEECKLVEEWIAQSAENRRIATQVHALYLASDTLNVMGKVDTERALVKVKGRMKVKRKTTWWEWTQRVAAVLFIPLLIGMLVQYFAEEEVLVQMVEVKTNPGMTTSVLLPDSTIVYLNSESSLSYPNVFTENTRVVSLKGEAYFSVAQNVQKQFIVSTPHNVQVAVYGTEFNIEAYPADKEINTTLASGEIGFFYTSANTRKRVMMKPGQKITYNIASNSVTLKNTQIDCDIAWKEGKLIFRDTPFAEVLKALSKRYNVEFVVKRPKVMDYSFTGVFEHQRLNRILEYFRISSNIKFRYMAENGGNIHKEKELIEIY